MFVHMYIFMYTYMCTYVFILRKFDILIPELSAIETHPQHTLTHTHKHTHTHTYTRIHTANISDTNFRNIRMCALSVSGKGRVDAKRCVFRDLQGAAFAAGVCVCLCVHVRACACVCVRVCVSEQLGMCQGQRLRFS